MSLSRNTSSAPIGVLWMRDARRMRRAARAVRRAFTWRRMSGIMALDVRVDNDDEQIGVRGENFAEMILEVFVFA